jgi:uncharacterized protein involved in propanediol utilization
MMESQDYKENNLNKMLPVSTMCSSSDSHGVPSSHSPVGLIYDQTAQRKDEK